MAPPGPAGKGEPMRVGAPIIFTLAAIAVWLPLWATGADEISRFTPEVEQLRGLQFTGPVEHRMLTRAELRSFLEVQIETELPVPAETWMATVEALHLVDATVSIDTMLDLYDAQVLAFYDPVGHVYYSLDEPPGDLVLPPAMTDAIVVHELTHALQDQVFDAGRRSLEVRSSWDAAIAYQAMLEGEALLVMIAYMGGIAGVTLDQLVESEMVVSSVRDSVAAGLDVTESTPAYFVESLKFPYVEGLTFVYEAYLDGGWGAVDAIHRDPPCSTREVLDPARYRERVAAGGCGDAPRLAEPSEQLIETTLGKFHWSFLLGREAARGWVSDVVSVRHGDGGATVLVETTWDDESAAARFERAYREFLDGKDAPNRSASREGARVKAAYGADVKAVRAFAGGAD
jgi:hypothetical protein